MLSVKIHLPVDGLWSSVLLAPDEVPFPRAINTWPFVSHVAAVLARAAFMLPVAVHLPEAWLYSSALGRIVVLPPPATSTSPFASNVAVWPVRAVVMLPVGVQVLELPRDGTAVLANNAMAINPPRRVSESRTCVRLRETWQPLFTDKSDAGIAVPVQAKRSH